VRVRAENLPKANRGAKGKLFVTLKDTDSVARLTSLVGKAEGASPKDAPEDKKEEKPRDNVQKPTVAISSNGHANENGHEKKATARAIEPTPAKNGKRAQEKSAPSKQKSHGKKSVPVKSSKPARNKETAPPIKAISKVKAEEDDDTEQMELPIASFKPLPKKK